MFDISKSVRGPGDDLLRTMWLWSQFDDRVIVPASTMTMNNLEGTSVTEDDLHANLNAVIAEMTEHLQEAGMNEKAYDLSKSRVMSTGVFGVDELRDVDYTPVKRQWALSLIDQWEDRLVIADQVIKVTPTE